MSCNCNKPKCDGKCGISPSVLQINNPGDCTLFHRVEVPASMGDSTTNPPKNGDYRNVLLYYVADGTSWLFSSDGIPQKLVNGFTNYEDAINLPSINGVTLLRNKTGEELGLQDKLTAGDGVEISSDNTISISDIEQYAHFFDTVADMKAANNLIDGSYAKTLGYYRVNDGGSSLYKIRTKTAGDVTNNGSLLQMDDAALVAELVCDEVNVKAFGAKSDGSEETTSTFQEAIDYAINSVKPLIIPNGTYLLSKVIINGFIVMKGEGFGTVLKGIDGNTENAIVYVVNDGTRKSEFSGFRIEGRGAYATADTSGLMLYVNSEGTAGDKYTYIHDISIYDCKGHGLEVNGYTNAAIREIRVKNIDVAGCGHNGIEIRNCSDSFFDTITSHSNLQHGFFLSGGNQKVSNCKAFYNGRGDETTIEDAYRIPASAFTVTSDAEPIEGKTYYTRSGNGVANDWYEFAVFEGSSFSVDVTYYELTKNYYKRYAGFNCSTTRSLYVNCETQENYGDGFIVYSSDNSFTSILCDTNGLLCASGTSTPISYASAGLEQLYYGMFTRCYRTSVYGKFAGYSYNTYGATQKAAIMVYKVNEIVGAISTNNQLNNHVIFTQSTNENAIKMTIDNRTYMFINKSTITPTSGYSIFDIRLYKTNNIVTLKLVVSADNGQILPDTNEHILLTLPYDFKPEDTYGDWMGVAGVSNDAGYNINKYCTYRLTANGQLSIRSSSAITDNKYVLVTLTFPSNR